MSDHISRDHPGPREGPRQDRRLTGRLHWLIPVGLTVVAMAGWILSSNAEEPSDAGAIAPAKVADYIHAIIQADRTVYTTQVVDRLQSQGIATAHEQWEQKRGVPLPAQFLQYSSRIVAEQRSGIRFRLVSLWPIYRRNGPATDFEREGLEAVVKHPDTPHRGIVKSGRKRFFQAIYADKAVSQACIGCHNAHPLSPRRDFKANEVMGGIVITIPLGD